MIEPKETAAAPIDDVTLNKPLDEEAQSIDEDKVETAKPQINVVRQGAAKENQEEDIEDDSS